ncbi:hypothetical protein ROR02_31950 [Pararhodospirillum oryzae]|uniref:Uncharacterized protein n=1 Tax=Pararhodospirillum oryzae TaxID=478448 RepID=A0A512HC92_9PROT|nr:hypothetical protein ROR02_31950 [Pararhodospirillum oryzae]
MSAAVKMTRNDLDANGLRREASKARDGDVARRLLALALIHEGKSRAEAAETTGMDRQTLRDWVHRYNEFGIDGLTDRKAPGRRPLLTAEQMEEVAGWVRTGPDIETDGIVRWRRRDLAARISDRFGVTLAERSVGDLLRRLGFRHLSCRPRHPRQDPQALEAHKKTSRTWSPARSRSMLESGRSNCGGKTRPASGSREL